MGKAREQVDLGTVRSLRTTRLSRPLAPPWGPGVDRFDLVVVELESSRGYTGTGFAWTPGVLAESIEAIVRHDLSAILHERDIDISGLWRTMSQTFGTMRHQGPVVLAIGAVDLALWDLMGRALEVPVAETIGTRRAAAPVYRSGLNFYWPTASILSQSAGWANAGATAIKLKVGRPDLDDDVALLRQVRTVVGPTCRLMIDANERWTASQAARAVERLSSFDLTWVEEPLDHVTEKAVGRLRDVSPVPIALGENLHSIDAFADVVDRRLADILQPNVCRVGGITPFLRVADLCERSGLQLAPHLLPELSGQLALTLPDPAVVEMPDDFTFTDLRLLREPAPMREVDQQLVPRGLPGLGMTFALA